MATGDESRGVTRHSTETRDATGRRRAEEEVRLLLSITQTIDATENFQSALEAVLREVCGATGWDYGEAWLPHPNGTVLESSPAWHGSTDALTRFRLVSEQITFPPGDGLPGRVWSSKQPEWIEDLWTKPDTVFFRAGAAQEADLKAGLGIPITANGEVLAVLVFFVSEPREEDRRLLQLISAVAQQLGGLIQRKRAEEVLRERDKRSASLVEAIPDMMFTVRRDGTYLDFVPAEGQEPLFPPSEFLGLTVPEVMPAELARTTMRLIEATLESGEMQRMEYELELDEGRHQYECRFVVAGEDEVLAIARDVTAQKRAEEALRASTLLLEKTFASLDEAVFVVEPNTRTIIACNSAAERVFGYSEKEMMGRNTEFLHVDRATFENFGRKLFPALDAHGVFHTEYQLRRKDGSVLFTEHTVTEIVDDSGQRTGLVSVLRDITERKRAEDALRESEERYRMIVDNTNEIFYKVSLEDDPLRGSVEFVSGHIESILGYAPDDFLQNPELWLRLVHPDDVPAIGEITREILASRGPGTRQYRLRHKETGEYRWLEDKMVPLTDGDGNVVGYQGVARDITERKQAEEALRESDERYRALVESAFEGIVISRAGKILEANESFARMFGYELPEVIGLSPVEMTTPESVELIYNNVQSGFEKPYEITGIKKDGATISIEVIGKNCVYQGREARITAFRDITEIKRAEEARQQAREELEGRVERQILRRNPYGLTFRELTALHLVAAGKSDKEIGIDLGISVLTARKHLSNILAKMDAASRTEAVARGLREGLLD